MKPKISNALLDELLKNYSQPGDLLGPDGLLTELKKRLINRVLDAELTTRLGYDEGRILSRIKGGRNECFRLRLRPQSSRRRPLDDSLVHRAHLRAVPTLSAIDFKMIRKPTAAAIVFALMTALLSAADVPAEMKRAEEFGKNAPSLLLRNEVRPYWSANDSFLVYRVNTGRDGHQFFKVDPASGAKSPAFDHELLTKALAKAANRNVRKNQLPLEQLELPERARSISFRAFGKS